MWEQNEVNYMSSRGSFHARTFQTGLKIAVSSQPKRECVALTWVLCVPAVWWMKWTSQVWTWMTLSENSRPRLRFKEKPRKWSGS